MKKIAFSVALLACLLLPASAVTFGVNLTMGARNANVKIMQQFLIDKGYLVGEATGYFGQQTRLAIQKFQKENGISQTGNWYAQTRQKAETLLVAPSTKPLAQNQKAATSSNTVVAGFSTSSSIVSSDRFVTLTVKSQTGGIAAIVNTNDACTDIYMCQKKFKLNEVVKLKASYNSGYSFKRWSEASCGTNLECSVKMTEDMTVVAYFEVKKQFEFSGRIISPSRETGVCYIPLGTDKCTQRFTWLSDAIYAVTVKFNDTEYYVTTEEKTPTSAKLDPKDMKDTEEEQAFGPIFFQLGIGPHKFELKSNGKSLDTVKVEAKCEDKYYWAGDKCWEKGANMLYVIEQRGMVVVSDPPRIKCGYDPDVCAAGFSKDEKVTLTAIPEDGYAFGGWLGVCEKETGTTCTLTINKLSTTGAKIK